MIFWVILHHAATNATVWLKGDWTLGNYLLTLCSPSVTLQPFEYCLPFDSVFDDVDEDHYTAELENWHEFCQGHLRREVDGSRGPRNRLPILRPRRAENKRPSPALNAFMRQLLVAQHNKRTLLIGRHRTPPRRGKPPRPWRVAPPEPYGKMPRGPFVREKCGNMPQNVVR